VPFPWVVSPPCTIKPGMIPWTWDEILALVLQDGFGDQMRCIYIIYIYNENKCSLWLFNIAMENGPSIDEL
jgi:hypothetical protein